MSSYLDTHDSVQLDAVLPAQFARHTAQLRPEHRLLTAVLVEAINSLRHGEKSRAGAEEWISSTDTSWPCTFESICDALGLDPAALRAHLTSRTNLRIRRPREIGTRTVTLRRTREAAA